MKEHKILATHRERGIGRLGMLIFILIVLATGFVAWQIVPFYVYYYDIVGMMEAQAKKASVFKDSEIRQTLKERIRDLELPVDNPDDDLKINRFDDKIIIDLKYTEVFYVDLGEGRVYDLHYFNFNPHVEVPLTGRKRK